MEWEEACSLLMIGYDKKLLQNIMEWDEKGAISLVGIVDPFYHLKAESNIPFVHSPDLLAEKEIQIIFIVNNEMRYVEEVNRFKKGNYVIINLEQYWILEKFIQQKIQIQKLKKDLKFLQTILTFSHEGVQYVDAHGIIQYVNPSFSRITNISPEERLGKYIAEVSPDGSLNKAYKMKTPVLGYKSTGLGSNVETIANAAPIFIDNQFMGAVTSFQDVTEIKYLTEKLMEHEQKQDMLYQQSSIGYQSKFSLSHIIGKSDEIKATLTTVKKAARTRSTVLITGESGTGKELFAHAIHTESRRNNKPFVTVDCAAIPEDLLESELFGYEKGAFTHALKQKIGKIELANEGTLFLDEIGEMSLSLQVKLLRVLQYKEFERIGGLKRIHSDFRIIAATNANLLKLVSEGKFREDLYYRLNVVRIKVPPLRHRKEDIPLLVEELITRIARRIGFHPMQLTSKGIATLAHYDWPGNIRELENILERLMNESTSSVIPDALIKQQIQMIAGVSSLQQDKVLEGESLPNTSPLPLKVIEKEHIRKTLEHYGSSLEDKKRAARTLGISISTLYNKIKDYQLE